MNDRDNRSDLCPICGKYRFPEPNTYEMCQVCGWFDDPLQYEQPDYTGENNKLSQNEYRKRWQNGELPPPILD